MSNDKSAEAIVRGATAAAKSLRWLANNFPDNGGEDETSKLSRCIHLYCKAGADSIDALMAPLSSSQQRERAAVEDIWQACATCAHSKKASCPWEGTYHHRGEHGEKIGVCNAWQWRGHQAAKEGNNP